MALEGDDGSQTGAAVAPISDSASRKRLLETAALRYRVALAGSGENHAAASRRDNLSHRLSSRIGIRPTT